MIARITIAALAATVLAGSAFALATASPFATTSHNETIIEKNQAFPLVGPLVVTPCETESCGDI